MTRIEILAKRRAKVEHLVSLHDSVKRYYSYMRSLPSRRTSKSKANAIGQVLLNSKLTHQVGLNSQLIGLASPQNYHRNIVH
jgi:hypothetical protein